MPRFGRRRGFGFGRVPRVPKPPKPPKVPAPPKPKVRDLKVILKGLVTTDIGQRINSLLYVLQWYDQAILYVTFKQKGQLTPEQRKSLDRVHKSRLQGQGTNFNDEKETAYRTAIRILEKLCDAELKPPKVDFYYDILDKKKPKLEQKADNWMARYGSTIQMLQSALQPKNEAGEDIEISIGPVQEEVQKDHELRRFVFRPDIAKQLHRKRLREGLLSVIAESTVLEELARLAATYKEIDQNNQPTGRLLCKNLHLPMAQMLKNLVAYGRLPEAPKRLVKAAIPVPINGQPAVPKAPKAPRAPGVPRVGGFSRRGPKIAGLFVASSDIGKLCAAILDGQAHSKQELQTKIASEVVRQLKAIERVARRNGHNWKLEWVGDQVTLHGVTGGQP